MGVEDRVAPFKWLGFEFVPPRWFYTALSALVVLALAGFLWLKVAQPYFDNQGERAHKLEEVAQYQRHFGEAMLYESTVLKGDAGAVTVGYYASDRCLVVIRRPPGSTSGAYHFIPETQYAGPPPGRIAVNGDLPIPFAAIGLAAPAQVRGRCVLPHPGQFQSWQGERRGCWVQVWRRWADGCVMYQFYD